MGQRHSKSDDIYERLLAVIRKEFSTGERFFTVRELARREHISLQTALNLVGRLRAAGVVKQEPGKSAIIQSKPGRRPPYTVAIAIHQRSGWFSARYLEGLLQGLGAKVPHDKLKIIDPAELRSVPSLETLAQQNFEGLIAVAETHPWALHYLKCKGMQVLSDHASSIWPGMPVTSIDFAATATEAGKLLARFGHRRALLVGAMHQGVSLPHFQKGFGKGQVDLIADFSSSEGYAAFNAIMNANHPTALYVANNPTLTAVLSELHGRAIRIPEEISLVMHDANQEPYSGFEVVPISSVAPPIQALGKALGQRMCRLIEEPEGDGPAVQMLAPTVRVTGSIRRAP